ncbi:hypothetical protein [Mycobacterium sp. TY814]|nr:hypothetical protein [Mycobacterium sp. TY814]MDP7726331.1 hypothetical protein [Mycobacterium sp. TY814]
MSARPTPQHRRKVIHVSHEILFHENECAYSMPFFTVADATE